MGTAVVFVDVGFIRGAAQGLVAPDPVAIAQWSEELADDLGERLLRTYWYDGVHDPEHPEYARQQTYVDVVRSTPGVFLRPGHIQERENRFRGPIEQAVARAAERVGVEADALLAAFEEEWEWRPVREQKGVDTLMSVDLVRLAQRRAVDTAVMVSGDRDLTEAVRIAQDEGVYVVLAGPRGSSAVVARGLRHLADQEIEVTPDELDGMVRRKERE